MIKFLLSILKSIGSLLLLLVFASGLSANAENRNFSWLSEQVKRCWNVGSNDEPIRIKVIVLIKEGLVSREDIALTGDYQQERAIVDANFEAARRAIIRCLNANTDLPDGKFEIVFDPSVNTTSSQTDLLGRGAQPSETAGSSNNAWLTEVKIKLYKDIYLGQTWADLLPDNRFTDCSEQGIRIACDLNHSFLRTDGTLFVVFEQDKVMRAMYQSSDLSLYQNAINFFPDQNFGLVILETHYGTIDVLSLMKQLGDGLAQARITEAEQSGLTSGFVSYTFLDAPNSAFEVSSNALDAMLQTPTGGRIITLSMQESFTGANVTILFEPVPIDEFTSRKVDAINEDF